MNENTENEISELVSLITEDDTYLHKLLMSCVGRICANISRRGGDWKTELNSIDLRHVVDWLKAAVIDKEPWLYKIDQKGNPKKLMKFGSLCAIICEADKAMLKGIQRKGVVVLLAGDEELFMELEDGYRLVRLCTPAALDREGSQMQHCVGEGAYDDDIESGSTLILSLRDQNNKSHATLEIEDGEVTQLRGKQNCTPVARYRNLLKPYFQKYNPPLKIELQELGYFVSANGKIHEFYDLPEGLTVKGDLDFSGIDISFLPNNLTVGGDLSIPGSSIKKLPDGLRVGGSLDISNTAITVIPNDCAIGKDLLLQGSSVKKIPSYFSIQGNLDINKCKLKHLPNRLVVGGNLYMRSTEISKLPDDLIVFGDLLLSKSLITSIPAGVKLGGSVKYQDKQDLKLPTNMLILENLDLRRSGINRLPDNLNVGGDLLIDGTNIAELPKGLRVGNVLEIDKSIQSLPADLVIDGVISIKGSPSKSLLNSVQDHFHLYDTRTYGSKSAIRGMLDFFEITRRMDPIVDGKQFKKIWSDVN